MAIPEKELLSILQQKFPNAQIKLQDTAGDMDHYALEIRDPSFAGIPLIKQHRVVNEALDELLRTRLHAISIKTGA